jgi:hypothetical protein
MISSVLTSPIAIMINSQRYSKRNVLSEATKHYSYARMIYIYIYLHCKLSHPNGGQKLPNMPSHPQDSLNQYIYFLGNYFYRLLRFKFARAATPSLCIAFLRSRFHGSSAWLQRSGSIALLSAAVDEAPTAQESVGQHHHQRHLSGNEYGAAVQRSRWQG